MSFRETSVFVNPINKYFFEADLVRVNYLSLNRWNLLKVSLSSDLMAAVCCGRTRQWLANYTREIIRPSAAVGTAQRERDPATTQTFRLAERCVLLFFKIKDSFLLVLNSFHHSGFPNRLSFRWWQGRAGPLRRYKSTWRWFQLMSDDENKANNNKNNIRERVENKAKECYHQR